jgi:hypothetical protein
MTADGDSELGRTCDEPPGLSGHADADRVREEERVRLRLGDVRRELEHSALVDLALERTAERDADRHSRAHTVGAPACDHPLRRLERLPHGRVLVPLVEGLRGAEREPHLVQPGGSQPVVALLVQGEAGIDDSVGAVECRDHFLAARHLRYTPRIDEARCLYDREPGPGEALHELGTGRGREDVWLVLETVPRPDVDDGHALPGAHGPTV